MEVRHREMHHLLTRYDVKFKETYERKSILQDQLRTHIEDEMDFHTTIGQILDTQEHNARKDRLLFNMNALSEELEQCIDKSGGSYTHTLWGRASFQPGPSPPQRKNQIVHDGHLYATLDDLPIQGPAWYGLIGKHEELEVQEGPIIRAAFDQLSRQGIQSTWKIGINKDHELVTSREDRLYVRFQMLFLDESDPDFHDVLPHHPLLPVIIASLRNHALGEDVLKILTRMIPHPKNTGIAELYSLVAERVNLNRTEGETEA
eukprot:gene56760-biopygen23038